MLFLILEIGHVEVQLGTFLYLKIHINEEKSTWYIAQ